MIETKRGLARAWFLPHAGFAWFAAACLAAASAAICVAPPRAAAAPPPAGSPEAGAAQSSSASPGSLPMAASILPSAGNGVERAGDPAVYASDKLYDYIDGGAPQFLEYGFHEVASQELKLNGHTYIFDAYRMRDPLAAFGIFSVRRPPLAKQAPALEGFSQSAFTGQQALLAYGPYYIEVMAYETTPETASETAALARRAVAALDPAFARADVTRRPPFDLLPAGYIAGSPRLARGPISVETALRGEGTAVFRRLVDKIAELQSRKEPIWLAAEYPLGHGKEMTLLLLAGDPRALAGTPAPTGATNPGAPGQPAASAAAAQATAPPALDARPIWIEWARDALREEAAATITNLPRTPSPRVVEFADGNGWLVAEPLRESWFITAQPAGLWMGRATAGPDSLSTWLRSHVTTEE